MQEDIPANVRRNLDYYLDHELEDPEYYGKLIMNISMRYGI